MRGQFYSIISMLLVIPILLFVLHYLSYSDSMGERVADRVVSDQVKQLVASIELDTMKAMEISGRRALLAATNHVLSSGEPLEDSAENLSRLMLMGTINGTGAFLMENNTMPNWSERIKAKSADFDVDLNYGNLSIENHDGFSLMVGMDLNVSVTDRLGKARIDKINERKEVTISVRGLEDPLFLLSTQGFIRRMVRYPEPEHVALNVVEGGALSEGTCTGEVTFNKSEDDGTKILVAENLTGVVYSRHLGIILEESDDLSAQVGCSVTGNASAVELVQKAASAGITNLHIDNGSRSAWSLPVKENMAERYYYRGNGPDFLQRLEGSDGTSEDGLITFIYVPELHEQALPVYDYSRVAHRYFGEEGDCYRVDGLPEWFGVDTSDSGELNLTGLLTGDPCIVS